MSQTTDISSVAKCLDYESSSEFTTESSLGEISAFDRLRFSKPTTSVPTRPVFQPVHYSEKYSDYKHKRFLIRAIEEKIWRNLEGLPEKKRRMFARAMSYYPGLLNSRHQPLKPIEEPFCSSPISEIRDLSYGDEKSPTLQSPPQNLIRDDVTISPITSKEPRFFKTPEQRRSKSFGYDLSPALSKLHISRSQPTEEADVPSAKESSPPVTESGRTPSPGFQSTFSPVCRKSASNRNFHTQRKTNVHFIKLGKIIKRARPTILNIKTISLPNRSVRTDGERRVSDRLSNESVQKGTEGCTVTESISASNTTSTSSVFLLVPNLIKSESKNLIIRFVHKFNSFWMNAQDAFDSRISHIVTETNELNSMEKRLCRDVQIEHLMAVGYKRYLVSLDWIRDSLNAGIVLDERDYEVVLDIESQVIPTKLARDRPKDLLDGFAFLCAKPFPGFTQKQLEELLGYSGGLIAKNPKELRSFKDKKRLCIVGNLAYYSKTKVKENLKSKLKKCKGVPVKFSWIFKCFCTYSVAPLAPYLFDTTVEEAVAVGISKNLLDFNY